MAFCRRFFTTRFHLTCFGPLVLLSFLLSILYLATTPLEQPPNNVYANIKAIAPNVTEIIYADNHHLAVVIPFRDVWNELMVFVPHIHQFLNKQRIRHTIIAVNQADILRFNRASLINVGFIVSMDHGCDYIAMHDVDLVPLNPELSYAYPKHGPFHVAAPEFHPKYHYPDFVGGILLLTAEHFKKVNGLSNKYWGWGLEDDEFRARLKDQNLEVYRPTNIKTGNKTLLHIHDSKERKRDYKRYGDQKRQSRIRDRITGVDSTEYRILSKQKLTIDGAPLLMLNVELSCDLELTPWCITPDQMRLYQNGSLGKATGYLRSKHR